METLSFLKSTEERFWKLEASYNYLFFLFDQLLQRCWNALKACAHAGLKKKKKKKKNQTITLNTEICCFRIISLD